MAKLIERYKGFLIKETTKRDDSTYKFQVCFKNHDIEWETDSIAEAKEFIDCYNT